MELSKLHSIEQITIKLLEEKSAKNPDSAVKLPEIIEFFSKHHANFSRNTLAAYISKLGRSGFSSVKSAGKKRGFYLSQPLSTTDTETPSLSPATEEPKTDSAKDKERLANEKKLYFLISDWLLAEDYSVKITADSKSNGKWGNPDVTGLKVTHTIAENKEIEIVTIEVKASLSQWEQYIFESVSHTRFSNLAYYCFAYPESERNSFDELYYYAEEYGLGLLGIEMEDEDYKNFLAGSYSPTIDEVEIIELQTPRFKTLRPFFREKFLKSLKISNLKELILWGTEGEPLREAS